jgi:autotransporter-associated beta strand protein
MSWTQRQQISHRSTLRSGSRAVLALAVAASLGGVSAVEAATYNWNDFTPNATTFWDDVSKWTLAAGDPHVGAAYPGGDVAVIDDIANIQLTAGLGAYVINYTGMAAASIASLTAGTTGGAATDTLALNINGTLNTTGQALLFSSSNTTGRTTVNVNSHLNVDGTMFTGPGTIINVADGGRLEVAAFNATGQSFTTVNVSTGGTAVFGSIVATGGSNGGVFEFNISGNFSADSITSNGSRDARNINVFGGTVSLGNVNIGRGVGGNAAVGSGGVHVFGGEVTANDFRIGTTNSGATAEVRGGMLTVNGPQFIVGQNITSRSSAIFMTGGTLIGTNAAGLLLGASNGTGGHGMGILNISSASSFVSLELLTLGTVTPSLLAAPGNNAGTLTMTTGTLYMGSGGIVGNTAVAVPNTSYGAAYGITLSGGTVGAKANWSTNANMTLGTVNGNITFKASDTANTPFNITINGNLIGGGGLTKTGGGTLTLAGASNSYVGSTNITEGTLLFTSGLPGGPVTVASGATLGGTGQVTGATTVAGGGRVAPGVPGVLDGIGTMSFTSTGGLTLESGAVINLDFSASPAINDIINLTAGTLTIGGPVTVNVLEAGTTNPFIGGGTFNIFTIPTGTSLVGNVSNLQIANNGTNNASNYVFSFVDNGTNGNSQIVLQIAGPLTGFHWNGLAGDGAWGTPGNWAGNAVPNAVGAAVSFGSLAAGAGSVALGGDRRAGVLTFDNSNAYTLNNTPGSKLFLDNGAETASIIVVKGTHTINSDMALESDALISSASRLIINGVVSSGPKKADSGITLLGAGTLVLANNNTYGGSTTVSVGSTLQLGNGGTTGSAGTGPVIVNGTLLYNRSDDFSVPNTFTGAGQIVQGGSGTLTVSDLGTFAGGIGVQSGTLLFNVPGAFTNNTTVSGGVLRVAPGITFGGALAMTGGVFDLAGSSANPINLSGTGGTIDNLIVGGDVVLTLGGVGATTFGGTIANSSGNVRIVKTGTGTVTLSGANTYSGSTTISQGVLGAGHSDAFSNSEVAINTSNGLLLGDGVNLDNTIVVASGTNGNEFVNVVANGTATLSGNLTVADGGHQYRISTTNTNAALVVTGNHNLGSAIPIIGRGNITYGGNAVLFSGIGTGLYVARQGPLTLTVKDNALLVGTGWTTGQGQSGAGSLTMTLSDQAHIDLSTGLGTVGTFNLQDIGNSTTSTTTATYNLNGGTITASRFIITRSDFAHLTNLNFNGTTLVAIEDSAEYLPTASNLTTRMQAGGLKINTNGFAVTVPTPLVHDAALLALDGGVTKLGLNTLTLTGANNYNGPTVVQQGTVVFGSGTTQSIGAISGPGTAIIDSSATVTSDGATVGALVINGTQVVRSNGGAAGASKLSSLVIAGSTDAWSGKLDLTNNALILTSPDATAKATLAARVKNQIGTGLAGGNGITSSTVDANTTLALADNADLNLAAYRGQTGLNANSLIVVQARFGDATLDGVVDAFDLNLLAAHWQQASGAFWSAGDFTGDGAVDAFDLNVLAANWQFGVGGSLQAALAAFPVFGDAVAAVPEPASLAVLALGGAALLGRRRRR